MSDILFIGDEISAAGFRLAGVNILIPKPGEESHVLDNLNDNLDLVIITAQVADTVLQHTIDQLMIQDKPLLLVLSDMRDQLLAPDLSVVLRSQLGLTE